MRSAAKFVVLVALSLVGTVIYADASVWTNTADVTGESGWSDATHGSGGGGWSWITWEHLAFPGSGTATGAQLSVEEEWSDWAPWIQFDWDFYDLYGILQPLPDQWCSAVSNYYVWDYDQTGGLGPDAFIDVSYETCWQADYISRQGWGIPEVLMFYGPTKQVASFDMFQELGMNWEIDYHRTVSFDISPSLVSWGLPLYMKGQMRHVNNSSGWFPAAEQSYSTWLGVGAATLQVQYSAGSGAIPELPPTLLAAGLPLIGLCLRRLRRR